MTQTNQSHSEEILASDIIIPYLLLVQDLSDLKKEKKAEPGDICKSSTAQKYGDAKTPVEVIFLHYPKLNWILEQKPKGATRYKYRSMFPRTAANENLPWEFWGDDDGNEVQAGAPGATQWKRVKQLGVFAILKKDIADFEAEKAKVASGALPDPNKALTPVLVSFRGQSYAAGKEVCSFFTQCKNFGVHLSSYSLPVTCQLVTDDENSYHVYSIDRNKSQPVPKEMQASVKVWLDMLANKNVNLKVETEEAPAERVVDGRPVKNYAPSS